MPPVKKGADQRYKQIYLSAFYDQDQEHRLVGVTRRQIQGLEQLLRREAERVGLLGAKERVGVIDGAACLKSALEVLPLLMILLDFYHLSEHVGQAAVATLGSPETPPMQGLAGPGSPHGAARGLRAVLPAASGLAHEAARRTSGRPPMRCWAMSRRGRR